MNPLLFFCLSLYLCSFTFADEFLFTTHFHSLPFYETDCSDADTVCNSLSVRGPFKRGKYYWRFVPYGENPIDRDDFKFHEFPSGVCEIDVLQAPKFYSFCFISFGTAYILEDDKDEGDESFAIVIYDDYGKEFAFIFDEKNFRLTEHVYFETQRGHVK